MNNFDLIGERFERAKANPRKLYTIQFMTPGGHQVTVSATNETLQDMMVGPMSRSDESKLKYPPATFGKELTGVPIKYLSEKAPFEFRNDDKPQPKKPKKHKVTQVEVIDSILADALKS